MPLSRNRHVVAADLVKQYVRSAANGLARSMAFVIDAVRVATSRGSQFPTIGHALTHWWSALNPNILRRKAQTRTRAKASGRVRKAVGVIQVIDA